ncbi:hypothetical protein Pla110_26320 [Polystyrenella longa]|uniref:Uncharacterized protein n=1 Tax=Polystyrenella longa TaxID=2528007 RepID=A0A518CNU1_9PLAN|nr:hypothetical protein [Polystyrenella longa]QDU80896.1 hypothetical protein Pla110_26320 [Polystyrenella longa]
MSPEKNENHSTPLSSRHQEMLSEIRQIDVEQSRQYAGIQFKLSFFILISGIAIALFVENWWLILIISISIASFFFLVSRAKHGFCELLGLIQAMDNQTDSMTATATSEQVTPPQS